MVAAADKVAAEKPSPLLDEWAVRYLHAPDTEFNRRWGRKLLVALIGRTFNPGCDLRTVFCILYQLPVLMGQFQHRDPLQLSRQQGASLPHQQCKPSTDQAQTVPL